MKKSKIAVCLSVAALIGAFLTPTLSLAQSKNQPMPVQAQVNANCNFTSSNTMTFTGYDTAATSNLDGTVMVDVRCTRGALVRIGIDTGANSAAATALGISTRAMRLGATTDYLGYEFYRDSGYSQVWTNSAPGWLSFTSLSNAPTAIPVYGRVLGGQDVPAGNYTDSVLVTVNY